MHPERLISHLTKVYSHDRCFNTNNDFALISTYFHTLEENGYGLSPANYINCIRLQQAEIQLLYSNKSVTEIAFEVGFSDSAYFSKLFKKYYGYSPLQHRLKYAANK